MVKILRKIFIIAVLLNVVEVSMPLVKKTMRQQKIRKKARIEDSKDKDEPVKKVKRTTQEKKAHAKNIMLLQKQELSSL